MQIVHAPLTFSVFLTLFFSARVTSAELFLGGGAKAGEVTDRTAIVHVRLTSTPGQNALGLIPGRDGQACLRYGTQESLQESLTTAWETARADQDHSIQFRLRDLRPAQRHYYQVELRETEGSSSSLAPLYDGVERPYSASRGGFVSVRYKPEERSLGVEFYSMKGEALYQKIFKP